MVSFSTQWLPEEQHASATEENQFNPAHDSAIASDLYYAGAEDSALLTSNPMHFSSHFTGCMELYADAATVMRYLDAHRGWFTRCAQPMQVEPIGENGYILTVGRYHSFGYEVEPKIGLDLLPQEQGVYRIQTIPLPDQESQTYQVDFQATLQLIEAPVRNSEHLISASEVTCIEWQLDLGVSIQFPKFVYRLPLNLLQRTGDRLLTQIVRQVSQRLTTKVQADFHQTLGITFPKSHGKRHKFSKH